MGVIAAVLAFLPEGDPDHPSEVEKVLKAEFRPWEDLIPFDDLPTVNAVLNACTFLLLCVGYVAIRRKNVRLHVTCMVSALCVSALFLASYLYYHFAIKHGRPTPFT